MSRSAASMYYECTRSGPICRDARESGNVLRECRYLALPSEFFNETLFGRRRCSFPLSSLVLRTRGSRGVVVPTLSQTGGESRNATSHGTNSLVSKLKTHDVLVPANCISAWTSRRWSGSGSPHVLVRGRCGRKTSEA
jgi:hypothetical protein